MGSYEQAGYSLGIGYVDPSDSSNKNLKQMKEEFYQKNYVCQSTWWLNGAIDKRFKQGDQSLYSYMAGANYNQQYSRFFFNLVRRNQNMMTGYQRRNRRSTIAIPIHNQDDPLADDYNAVMRWSEERSGFQEYHSEAFEGAIDCGMSLMWMYMDYALDGRSGDIFDDCVSWNNFLIDTFFRKQDLSDCNGVWRRRWTSKMGAKLLLPGYEKEIDRMRPGGMKDGRFPVQAELQNTAVNNLFTYDEFHYRTTREAKMVIDPYTGESVEWEDQEGDADDLMEMTLQQQPWLIVKKMQIPTTKMILSLGDKIVYHGRNQINTDSYPCVPYLCFYEPDMPQYALRCMGTIRNARDPQWIYNMRKIIELNILQSQINSGWIYPVDVVTDVKAFRQSGEGFLIPLKAGRQPNEIQRIEPVAIPQSLLELSKGLADDISKITGINEELLGAAQDDKAGILAMLRQGAGLTTLQTIYDKLDYSQRLYGKIRLQAIRKNFSKGKIRSILGHDADPRFFTSHSQKYSIGIEEGNYSTTQRQMELQQLLHFRELGMQIPDKSILRAAFITNKRQIIQDMEEDAQQQAQAQQMASQVEMQKSQSDINLKNAQAAEKYAKIEDDKASAQHKETQADYELVKMMMELEDMEVEKLRKSFDLAQAIKLGNKVESEANRMPVGQGV